MDKKNDIKESVLMTREEYEKDRRARVKKNIYRVLMVLGLGTAFVLLYAGVLDLLFDISLFGKLFGNAASKLKYTQFWEYVAKTKSFVDETGIAHNTSAIYKDYFQFGTWLPKFSVTLVLCGAVLAIFGLLSYTLVDVYIVIRNLVMRVKNITNDLKENIAMSAEDEGFSTKKKKEKKVKEPKKKEEVVKEEVKEEPAKVVKEPVKKPAKPKKEKPVKEEKIEVSGIDLSSQNDDYINDLMNGKVDFVSMARREE